MAKPNSPDLAFPADVSIAYCPERVLPGNIMTELNENDRIIGGLSEQCSQQAVDLYQIFAKKDVVSHHHSSHSGDVQVEWKSAQLFRDEHCLCQ